MAYKALYRTYRPQNFSEVIGQQAIVRTLQNALTTGKISHAYLFSGPRGTGKTTVARIFAKAINCDKSPISEPCGKCISCQEISESNNPDVIEIDAASNNGVDEIRDIREKVKFLPGGSKYKIYIIDEVHMLSQGAFNALLKTLEEPPKHVIFILATTEPHKVIPTIISRCQRFDFKALSVKEIADLIEMVAQEEKMQISTEAIVAIAEGAEGGMRDALSYLDQAASFTDDSITIDDVNSVTGNLNYDKIIELAKYFESKNINEALNTVNDLVIMGKEINKIVSGMLQFYRDVLLYKNIDTSMFTKYIYEKEDFKTLAKQIDINKIFYYVDVLSDVQVKIKTSSTPHIYLEVALIKMMKTSTSDLNYLGKISELEEKMKEISIPKASGEIDNTKVNALESKLNRVVSELSKLELHKLLERITKIESDKDESNTNQNDNPKYDDIVENLNNMQIQIETNNNNINELQNLKDQIENLISIKQNENNFNKEEANLDLISEKISMLESKVYKLMPGNLESQSQPNKKAKIKINEGQIGLFSEDIVETKDLDTQDNEVYDLDEHQNNQQESLEVEENNDIQGAEDPIEDCETKDEQERVYSIKDFKQNDSEKTDVQSKFIKVEDLKLSDLQDERFVNEVENEEIVVKPNSQLVKKKTQEKDAIEIKPTIFDKEFIQETPKQNQEELDEYSQFSITVIERILHTSRTELARNDKARLVNLWRSLDKGCQNEIKDVAELLQEGQIVAVGEKEFIITYPNASMCNQVMKHKFKKGSLKLLYDSLGETYNYIAVPEDLWKEKRIEYINQYNIGVRYPKLTPIADPNLNVEKESDFLTNQEKSIKKAINLFGENIVKIE